MLKNGKQMLKKDYYARLRQGLQQVPRKASPDKKVVLNLAVIFE
jgi:hypothetical protein